MKRKINLYAKVYLFCNALDSSDRDGIIQREVLDALGIDISEYYYSIFFDIIGEHKFENGTSTYIQYKVEANGLVNKIYNKILQNLSLEQLVQLKDINEHSNR